LFLAGTAVAILMSVRYMEAEHENHGEYYALMLLSVVGMMCMAAGFDIVLIFIGLELMAISTYVLVGFLRRDRRSNEAALKYLLLGAFSSGIFAYGLSLFYGLTGSTNLYEIAKRLPPILEDSRKPVAIIALLTTVTGLLFKIAAVPFHQWAPDAYEGAPTSITGFMSVAVKAAGWAMLMRILLWGLFPMRPIWGPLLVFVSIATMTGANFAALTQTNTKRLLAYSSIAHVGYMLLGMIVLASTPYPSPAFFDGFKGILIYLLVYTFMNLGAFGVITSLRHKNVIGDELDDLNGLYSRAPVEAVLMLVFMLSLAGIPPMAGFWAMPSAQFTIWMKRSGMMPMKTVAKPVRASAVRIPRLTGSLSSPASAWRMNIAFAILGYRVYTVEMANPQGSSKGSVILMSKRDAPPPTGASIDGLRLSDTVFTERDDADAG